MKNMYAKGKNAGMPVDHFEMKENDLNVCKEKYGSKDTMKNAEDYDRLNNAMVSYAKKHKMKY